MKILKIINKYLILVLFASVLFACKEEPDFKFGDYTDVEGFYPYVTNKGAIINNVRPHSGEIFRLQLNYYSKTPVNKITLLGKAVNGSRLPSAERYTDLEVIKEYTKAEINNKSGFSKELQVDTIIMGWKIPKEINNNAAYVYYRIAVECDNALSDTTSGDYWKVKPFSDEARIRYLFINGEALDNFDKSTYEYNVDLRSGTTETPRFKVVTYDLAASKVVINNATNLQGSEEERTSTITVYAEDGKTTKTYSITFSVN